MSFFKKEKPVVEESIFLRVLWFFLSLLCVTMISEVDRSYSTVPIGDFKLPLIVVYLWMCISGAFLTYHYRHDPPKWLTGVGLCGIMTVIWWFASNIHQQWSLTGEVELLLPMVHLVAGLFVSHSFELRTRGDFNFSVLLSLLVVFMVSTLGKGLGFGIGMLLYLALAGIMLLLDCESRTFGNVCERGIDGLDLHLFSTESRTEKTANLLFPIGCMTALTITLFIALPRAEALADQFTAQLFAMLRPEQDSDDMLKRINMKNPLKPKTTQGQGQDKPGDEGEKIGTDKTGDATGKGQSGKDGGKENPNDQKDDPKAKRGGSKAGDKDDNGKAGSQQSQSKPGEKPQNSKPPEQTPNQPGQKQGVKPPTQQPQNQQNDNTKDQQQLDMDSPVPTSEEIAFTVQVNRTTYYKQAALDYFDGRVWKPSQPDLFVKLIPRADNDFVVPVMPSETLPQDVPSIVLKQSYKCNGELGHKIPFAGFPEEIQFPAAELKLDSCGALRTDWSIIPGLNYNVSSALPLYNFSKMKAAPNLFPGLERDVKEGLANYLQLPKSHDPEVTKLAQTVSGAGNWFVKAERLSDYLRKNYKSADVQGKRPGNLVNHFVLKSKAGNCKEFAGTLAVMCRSIGIPARVAVGFSSGDFDPASGMRQVKFKHGHTWAEVFVPRAGWVPFDATPEGTMPERSGEQERYINSLKDNWDNNSSTEQQNQQPQDQAQQPTQPAKKPGLSMPSWNSIFSMALMGIPGFLVLAMVGTTLVASVRAVKFLQKQRKIHPASKLYGRFLQDLRQLGINAKVSDTPADIRTRVQQLPLAAESAEDLKLAIDEFLNAYNRVYFGEKNEMGQVDRSYQEFSFRLKNTLKNR